MMESFFDDEELNNTENLIEYLDLFINEIKIKVKEETKIELAKIMKNKKYKIEEISSITGVDIRIIDLLK